MLVCSLPWSSAGWLAVDFGGQPIGSSSVAESERDNVDSKRPPKTTCLSNASISKLNTRARTEGFSKMDVRARELLREDGEHAMGNSSLHLN